MDSVYMICMVMYGNGSKIIGMEIIKGHLRMGVLGQAVNATRTGLFAAGVGASALVIVARRFAAAIRPAVAATSSVFGSPDPLEPLALEPLLPWHAHSRRNDGRMAAKRQPTPYAHRCAGDLK